jgi:hypothetical protein
VVRSSYSANGLYHATFVKTLTNLTPLGPGDGGTTVIPGSHKVAVEDRAAVIAAAYGDPDNLIHTVVAPPGSTLLFGEALIHATGQIRTENRRCIIIGGYTPPQFQAWQGQEPSVEFVASAPQFLRTMLSGGAKWSWRRRALCASLCLSVSVSHANGVWSRRARELGNDATSPAPTLVNIICVLPFLSVCVSIDLCVLNTLHLLYEQVVGDARRHEQRAAL